MYDDLVGIQWKWQPLSISVRAQLGDSTGPNPKDRGKLGSTKRHVLTDQDGIPLSVVITSANIHDMKSTTEILDKIAIEIDCSTIDIASVLFSL